VKLLKPLFILFTISLPLFLLATNLSLAVKSLPLYKYGFDKYNVAERMGIDEKEVIRIAKAIIFYFHSPEERIDVGGDFFNQKEIIHLRDVKGLIRLSAHIQRVAGACCLAFLTLGFILLKRRFLPILAKGLILSSGVTFLVMLFFALSIIAGFDRLFLYFHLVSFRNPFWMLDPSKDRLIMMFPEGFFFDAGLFIALATILEVTLLGGLAFWYLRRLARATIATGQGTSGAG